MDDYHSKFVEVIQDNASWKVEEKDIDLDEDFSSDDKIVFEVKLQKHSTEPARGKGIPHPTEQDVRMVKQNLTGSNLENWTSAAYLPAEFRGAEQTSDPHLFVEFELDES